MAYVGPGRKDRRRKAAAHLPGQLDLDGKSKEVVSLPPKIPPNVHTLFLGLGPGLQSAIRGHYFPGHNNYFWKLLRFSGLCPAATDSDHDDDILAYGFGLADVIERPTEGSVLATKAEFLNAKARVTALVEMHKPKLVVFVGLRSYRTFLRKDKAVVEYGEQSARIGTARVWLVPSTSGASVGITSYSEKMEWFEKLAAVVKDL